MLLICFLDYLIIKLKIDNNQIHIRPGGLMDKAADSGSADMGSIPVRDAI